MNIIKIFKIIMVKLLNNKLDDLLNILNTYSKISYFLLEVNFYKNSFLHIIHLRFLYHKNLL